MLRNRQTKETTALQGVNIAVHDTKLQLGTFKRLENWIPGKVIKGKTKIIKKRGPALLSSGPPEEVLVPSSCGECAGYDPQTLDTTLVLPSGTAYTDWVAATSSNVRISTGHIGIVPGGNLEAYIYANDASANAGQGDAYGAWPNNTVFHAIWQPDGTLVSITDLGAGVGVPPGFADIPSNTVRESWVGVISTDVGGHFSSDEHCWFMLAGIFEGNPYIVYPERDSGAGQAIKLDTGSSVTSGMKGCASFGGPSGNFFTFGINGSAQATLARFTNDHGASAPYNDWISDTVFSDYEKMTSYQAGEVYSWAVVWDGIEDFPFLLKLDATTDAVLDTISLEVGTYIEQDYNGFCIVDDRFAFQCFDAVGNNDPFALYIADLDGAGTWSAIDTTISKLTATSSAGGSNRLLYTIGPNNQIYFCWWEMFNLGSSGQFWSPALECI